jgi:hypothetical protein
MDIKLLLHLLHPLQKEHQLLHLLQLQLIYLQFLDRILVMCMFLMM